MCWLVISASGAKLLPGSTLTTNEGPRNRQTFSNRRRLLQPVGLLGLAFARRDLKLTFLGWRRRGLGEGTKEEYELPALVRGQTVLERGHGAAALGDLVEDVAVGESVHVWGVGEIVGGGLLHPGLGAIAFATIAVALGALFAVDFAGGAQIGFGRLERALKFLEFVGDDPRFALLGSPVDDQNENECKKSGEDKSAELEIL
jgi:hypothetical protein